MRVRTYLCLVLPLFNMSSLECGALDQINQNLKQNVYTIFNLIAISVHKEDDTETKIEISSRIVDQEKEIRKLLETMRENVPRTKAAQAAGKENSLQGNPSNTYPLFFCLPTQELSLAMHHPISYILYYSHILPERHDVLDTSQKIASYYQKAMEHALKIIADFKDTLPELFTQEGCGDKALYEVVELIVTDEQSIPKLLTRDEFPRQSSKSFWDRLISYYPSNTWHTPIRGDTIFELLLKQYDAENSGLSEWATLVLHSVTEIANPAHIASMQDFIAESEQPHIQNHFTKISNLLSHALEKNPKLASMQSDSGYYPIHYILDIEQQLKRSPTAKDIAFKQAPSDGQKGHQMGAAAAGITTQLAAAESKLPEMYRDEIKQLMETIVTYAGPKQLTYPHPTREITPIEASSIARDIYVGHVKKQLEQLYTDVAYLQSVLPR